MTICENCYKLILENLILHCWICGKAFCSGRCLRIWHKNKNCSLDKEPTFYKNNSPQTKQKEIGKAEMVSNYRETAQSPITAVSNDKTVDTNNLIWKYKKETY